ncbi:non-ribosomal peptide synthetase/type I polyketide synthase [Micromonospora sp. LH3U1]|uniref:non-ribosomal peptide synthetase/type I polyketide synthase n=1 Tax=Micromonospora sp. LH3U1 TaxID=3018339 RepID=UPI00234A59AA|nr:non-ribosomal peptide synthetase/type I polyketide synthase [Micromonospora sp. LH3U1]WCN82395.1 amino acid adenylation domain-containing protein [Micromonospora sp. LH3U1]
MTEVRPLPDNAIAVVGMALRVPGAATLDDFWGNLRDGVESITTLGDADLIADGVPPEEFNHPDYVRALGVLDDPAGFDARFFGFSAREAQLLDPQHRLFLECVWEALEHAGHPFDATEPVTGVYAGVGESSYLLHNLLPNADLVARVGAFQTSIGNDKDFMPTRVSYKVNLHGPSISVQTGCSTSLVAVHMAAQALLAGECDVALAGGATVIARRRGYRHAQGGILSADGHCRAFDAEATGAVAGSGAAVVVLKRLADAVADGDIVHGVIRGSAVNNDGARKVGFTAPSVDGQADVIAEALAVAGVAPDTIGYVEAHGTGTPLGDPIEVAALKSVFRDVPPGRIGLGSVKTNVGHLDTAAGVVGLIKTVLALQAGEIPPSLHFRTPNPELGLAGSPFHVVAARTPWPGEVRRAGVSSFGIGGTNAHVVLEEAPTPAPREESRHRHVLPLSAATPTALDTAAARLAAHLRAHPDLPLTDVAYTLQRGRRTLPYRRAVVGGSPAKVVEALERPAARGAAETATDRAVLFTFPGQGAQRSGMGQALYAGEPVFRAEVDRAAELLEPLIGEDIRRLLYPADDERATAELLHQTRYAQPALFVVEYALAKLWAEWGVRPAALLGHSVGELVAACLAGVFTVPDALRLVAARGRLMQAAEPGAMLAVPLSEDDLLPLLDDGLDLAAVNGPRQCTVSGAPEDVAAFEVRLRERGLTATRLATSHAFHSRSMAAAAAAFETEVAQVRRSAPDIPFVSNVTGTWITAEMATSPSYWSRQLRSTVRFADGLESLRRSDAVLLEVGPGRVLTRLAGGPPARAVASLPSAGRDADAETELLAAVGALWRLGAPIDWEALHGDVTPLRTVLPTYPFERERCWIDPPRDTVAGRTGVDGLTVRGYRRAGSAGPAVAVSGTWLAFGAGLPDGVVDELRGAGTRVVAADLDTATGSLTTSLAPDERIAGVLLAVGSADPSPALAALGAALAARGDTYARVVVVTDGALDVTGSEDLVPPRGVLVDWAAGGAPGTRTLLDVVPAATSAAARRLAVAVAREIRSAHPEPVVALRGGHRFVPHVMPAPAAPPDRHTGALYLLAGDAVAGAAFRRALTTAGATVSDLGADGHGTADPATVLVPVDGRASVDEALAALAAARVDARGPVAAVEVHVLGGTPDTPLAGRIAAQVAASGRESDAEWVTYVWPAGDLSAVERTVARVVGAASSTCHLVVTALDETEETATETSGDIAAYADSTEREVAAIFADLLGERDVALTAGFFELGGHSLLAAQLVAQVGRVCGADIPLRAFVAEPTVRGLAAAVRAARAETGDAGPESLPAVVLDPASAHVPFPLTDVQQAYWIGRTGVFELGNVGMHGYEEFDVPELDVPRLERALRRLIRRHGALRAVVLPHGEQQVLEEVPDYVIVTEDVRGRPDAEVTAVLERTRADMSHQVFVPDRWPLFELRATLLDDGQGRVHYSIDGLITDAWASSIVMRELTLLYNEPDATLPELELSFRDYVLAAQAAESTDRYQRAAAYWQERVPTLALAPELPLAADPHTIAAPRFARLTGQVPAEVWGPVKAAASRRGLTPTALLLAAYGEVVATWSKTRRFSLNLPMAHRLPLHPQVDAILGDFTSVTLLEIDAVGAASFETRARAIRDQLLADLDHGLFSGVRVARELKRVRGDAAAVLPVVFTSLFQGIGGHPQIGEVVYSISQTPQIWIDTQVYELDGALVLDIDAVEDLFPDGMVAAMHAATLKVVSWLAADEAHWVDPVPSLVPSAELAAHAAYNRTDGPLPTGLLHEPFFATAARVPERPAVITPTRSLTYGELADRARAIAAHLGGLRVRPDELVAVVMDKGWEQCAAVLGVLAAGAAYLPIDPDLPDERVRFLLAHGQVRAVLTQGHLADSGVERFGDLEVLRVDDLRALPAGELPAIATTPRDLAYVIFTSGSTGLPKGVMIDHRGALNTVVDINERFRVGEDDRVLALSSLSFDLSVYDVFGPLAVGGAVVIPEAAAHRDPAAWLDLVTKANVTIWNSVPALMELFVEHLTVRDATGGLRLVMLSGDWIPVALPDRIRQVLDGPEVVSLGGATEASIWSILYPVGEVPATWTSIPYGRPMVNQTFHVLDDALRPRPTGVPGQLHIGGVGLARGYLRDEARTAASFVVDPATGERLYRTGDLGRFLPSGEIEFLGREDFQVKVQGYRIELGEIEAALAQHPEVRGAVVVAHGEPRGAKRLVGFVVPQVPGGMPVDVREFLAGKLPGYMVPAAFHEIDELPLTANGKVDRRPLLDLADAVETDDVPYEAPRSVLEETVAEVWASILRVDRIGVHDNFFALGGDSLLAMRAVVHLRKAFDVQVPIRVLFDSQTLEAAALAIEDQLLAELEEMSDEEASSLLSNEPTY